MIDHLFELMIQWTGVLEIISLATRSASESGGSTLVGPEVVGVFPSQIIVVGSVLHLGGLVADPAILGES